MKVKAQRISMKNDNITYCRPSDGYDADNALEVELDHYEEIDSVAKELPESDERYPKGAPWDDYIKVGEKIFKRKA